MNNCKISYIEVKDIPPGSIKLSEGVYLAKVPSQGKHAHKTVYLLPSETSDKNAKGKPYFVLRSAGWGTGWAAGNQLWFNTTDAEEILFNQEGKP